MAYLRTASCLVAAAFMVAAPAALGIPAALAEPAVAGAGHDACPYKVATPPAVDS
ncbi:MAG: D-alanyl-D-alanine carboxypeptidase, partial [Mycobacterium sp.]